MSVRDWQLAMAARGFDPGPIDGDFGTSTMRASMAVLDAAAPPAAVIWTSPLGVAAIAAHEGLVPGPYLDSKGILTVYVGHTAAAGAPDPAEMPRGMPADLEDAIDTGFEVFARDLAKFEARVRKAITVPIAQHEFDAAVSFDFNTGAIHSAEWVKALNRGDRSTAAEQIMNWRKPVEIIPRRQAEQRLFRDGVYPAKPTPVWRVDSGGQVIWRAVMTLSPAEVAARLARVA